jgi:hypothetical protein
MMLAQLISVSYYATMSDQSWNGSRVLASYNAVAKEHASPPWRVVVSDELGVSKGSLYIPSLFLLC